jgi:DNA-binding transcriptional LysR family regulator
MKLAQVQYVLAVAEMGSFTEAAAELYISQSSLSKQIIALEKELGLALFDRSRRQIALTPAGKTFLTHARALNDTYLAMMAELTAHKTAPSVSILAIPVIAQYGIPAYLAQFKRAHPKLDVTLEEREAVEILPALDERSARGAGYDLAIVRDNYLDAGRYDTAVIARDRLLVAVSTTHRFAERRFVSLEELSDENFVTVGRASLLQELTEDACRQAGFEPRISYVSLRAESILGLVASNSGIALMMERIFDHSKHIGVVGVPLDETVPSNVVLAWPKHKRLSRAAQTFVEFVKKQAQ